MGLRIYLLGPMRVLDGQSAIKLPPRSRHLSLWSYLLIHRRRPTPRNLLAYTFWPDAPEAESRLNLRRHAHRLSELLPAAAPGNPWLLSDRSTLQWNPAADFWLDVAEFERLSAEPARLADAVDLYDGDLLEGLYDDWVFSERERLREVYVQDLHGLTQCFESAGDYRQAILSAQRLLRHDPLREETYRTLMRLHARSGDRAGIVRYFNSCVTVLEREMDVKPSPETVETYQEYLAKDAPAEGEAPLRQPARPFSRHNIPAQLTSFVGRERELEEIRRLLWTTRLVTLTGIGGVGKTRLALALAESVVDRFADGVWWVDLSPLTDPSLTAHAVASAIGLREQSTRPTALALADAVRSKAPLLVLDGCEHLVEAIAQIVEALLREAPEVRFLVTSTEPLGVAGEVTWQVPPLSLSPAVPEGQTHTVPEDPRQTSASVRLFIDRALSALPTLHLTPGSLSAVARVCRALDGIPLALELAAARLKMLTVEQLVDRLDDRFRLLAGGSRSVLPRHRTMRAVLDWSHGLLSDREQALFRRLCLFVGGFTLESAEMVCAGEPLAREEVLQILSELVDKSLVMVSRTDPVRARYRLLETVGYYAREKLLESGEASRVQEAYTGHFVGLIDQAGDRLLRGPDQEKWFRTIGQEYDNLRGIMSNAEAGGDIETLASIAGRLWPFWWTHGDVAEGRRWLEGVVSRRQSLQPGLQASVLHAAGRLMVLQGDYPQAMAVLEENLSVCRRQGDLPAVADALSSLGVVANQLKDYDRADQVWRDALEAYRTHGDRWGVARALNNLGDLSIYRGDYAGAVERLQESVALFREMDSTLGESIGLINLGRAALQLGDTARAAAFFRESLKIKVSLADKEGIAWNLEGLAGVAGEEKDPDRAARLYGAAEALRKAIGIPIPAPDVPLYERSMNRARSQLESDIWQARWSEGAGMDTDQTLAYALQGGPP